MASFYCLVSNDYDPTRVLWIKKSICWRQMQRKKQLEILKLAKNQAWESADFMDFIMVKTILLQYH